MSKPFDATLKELFELNPVDWAHFIGCPASNAELIDADVSTVTAASDKVIHVQDEPEWLLHVELQSSPDQTVPERCHFYSAALRRKHRLQVRSVVIVLRRPANLSNLTGLYEDQMEDEEEPYLTFRYRVIRLWERNVEEVLNGGIGVLPLAPLCNNAEEQIETILDTIAERFQSVQPQSRRNDLWVATSVLMGLRYERAFIGQLFQRIASMEDSVAYQMIMEKGVEKGIKEGIEQGKKVGAVESLRHLLLLQATARFGEPAPEIQQQLQAMDDVEQLEQLGLRIQTVDSWEQLFQQDKAE